MNKNYDDTAYAYAVGRIQAIEGKMLDDSKLEAMLSSRSFSDAVKVAADSGYTPMENYEEMLKAELDKTYDLLYELIGHDKVIDIFLLKNDYHNLKVLIKQEFLNNEGITYDDIFIKRGSMLSDDIALNFVNRDFDGWDPLMKDAVTNAIEMMKTERDPQKIDIILDKALYMQMMKYAEDVPDNFVKNLISVMIDTVNIKMFIRVKNIGKDARFLKSALLSGGIIGKDVFVDCLDLGEDAFLSAMRLTDYSNLAEKAFEVPLLSFERLCDLYILRYVEDSKYEGLGLKPIIGYLIKKEEEIRAVRIILIGKINDIPISDLRERIKRDA